MSCDNKAIKDDNKNIEFETDFNKEIESNFSFLKMITTVITFCVEGFAKITGIGLSATIAFIAEVSMKLFKSMSIDSTVKFNAFMTFMAKKKLQIDATTNLNATVSLLKRMKMEIYSTSEFVMKKDRILGELDELTLGDMDVITLGDLGFYYGVNFILLKKLAAESTLELTATMGLSMYYYNRLEDWDGFTLGDLDTMTLGEMDRTIIT